MDGITKINLGGIALIGILAALPCLMDNRPDEYPTNIFRKVENIETVFYHGYQSYTVMVNYGNSSKIVGVGPYIKGSKFIFDVPKGSFGWADIQTTYIGHRYSGHAKDEYVTFHLKEKEQIEGGGWNYGKGGSGTVTVIK